MASTVALFTGLSGLLTHSRKLDVIGNNIANVNTTAYKSNRMLFEPTFSRTFSIGTSPSGLSGGTNPGQIGLGVSLAGTQRDFSNGALTATGVSTDVAIEGEGFFVVNMNGSRMFTRAGAFQFNEANDLVTIAGGRVMGYPIDENFNVVEGDLVELNIPVGTLTLAEASRNVTLNGNLNASGEIPTSGSVHDFRAMFTDAGLTTPVVPGTDLTSTDIYMDDGGGTPIQIFGAGAKTITISGVEKGGKDLGTASFAFSATAVPGTDAFGPTFQDYMDFLDDYLGLDGSTIAGESLSGGVSMSGGVISVTGNEGTVQDLDLETPDMIASGAGALTAQPFVVQQSAAADGESVRTSMVVYDSLGTAVTVDLTFVLQSTTPSGGTTWEWIAESNDNADLDRIVGLGVVDFDEEGRFTTTTNQSFSVTRDNGAVSPLNVNMEFSNGADAISALTDNGSAFAAVFQDGSAIGTLSGFSIGQDGTLSGSFTNGLTRSVGQVAIAKFSNPEGLVDSGNNFFSVGPNSGSALIAKPLEFGTGRLVGGALELSNVDLSQEFIDMILASTGYSAASRVISTTDELMDQLLLLGR